MLIQNDINLVERKWGHFLQFTENENTTVKILYLKKGGSTHYQYHNFRSEQWFIIRGRAYVTKGIISEILLPGQSITIDVKEKHKIEAIDDCTVLEVARGHFHEKDIIHL